MTRYLTGGALALVLALGAAYWLSTGPSTPPAPALGAANAQSSDVDVSTIIEMAQGVEDAPVTVIEYASFTCPHCATFHAGPYKQLKTDYVDTGKVRFIYREVYFDRFGLWASMVARCGGPERFFGITDLIYQQQSDWSRAGEPTAVVAALRKIGVIAGLTEEQLDACLSDGEKAQTLVSWYQQNADADGITSTPSFVIDGEKHSNMSYADLSALIDEKLEG